MSGSEHKCNESAAMPLKKRLKLECGLGKRCRTVEEARDEVFLNCDIMEVIFSKMPLSDQNNMRLVCKSWNSVAHRLWWNSVYNFDEQWHKNSNFDKALVSLKNRPLLKKFICLVNKDVVRLVLLKYVENLHHLELDIVDPGFLQRVLEKYPNLCSIMIGENSPDLLTSVQMLVQCPNLQKLVFFRGITNRDVANIASHHKICRLIAEKCTELKELVLFGVENSETVEELGNLLQSRGEKLTSLDLVFCAYSKGNSCRILNVCQNLESLKLDLNSPTCAFDLSELRNLNSLTLIFRGEYEEEILRNTVISALSADSWPNLERLDLQLADQKFDLQVIELITSKLHNLKELSLVNVEHEMDGKLSKLPKLLKLHTLRIYGSKLSECAMECVSKCRNLKDVVFCNCSVSLKSLIPLSKSRSLKNLGLQCSLLKTAGECPQALASLRHLKITWIASA